MLQPPPDRFEFEKEFKKLIPTDGDITAIARWTQKDLSTISKMYNPGVAERVNPFYFTTLNLFAFDCMRDRLADDALAFVTRTRMKWLPAPLVSVDPAETTSDILQQFKELMDSELKHLPIDVQLKEAQDVERAAQRKVDEILRRRADKIQRTG